MNNTINELTNELSFVLNKVKFNSNDNLFIVNRSLLGSIITKKDNFTELDFNNILKFNEDEYEKRVDLRLKLRYLFDKELKLSKN